MAYTLGSYPRNIWVRFPVPASNSRSLQPGTRAGSLNVLARL